MADEFQAGSRAADRARQALAALVSAPDAEADPLLPAALLALNCSTPDPLLNRLLDRYESVTPGYGRQNAHRYRWGLGFRDEPSHPLYAGRRVHWRPREAAWRADRPGDYGRRLMVPITLATQLEFWGRTVARGADGISDRADRLLAGSQEVAENDVAAWIAAADPWADTFALWQLTTYPRAYARLRDLTFGLAVRYGQMAWRQGVVAGIRHPFWREQLASGTAHLAIALWRLGVYPTLLPRLLESVRSQQRPDGGWGDPGQPSDVLTTLAAAELLGSLDPTFDPCPPLIFFERRQEPAGWWRALGPEVPWLTAAIGTWIEAIRQPFADRFRWPELPVWSRDRTTGLPTMAVFDELAVAMSGVPGLADTALEVAFIDLAGFGAFNNRYGMDAGDAALAAYADALRRVPRTMTIRQGGDELLVLGPPGELGALEPRLREFIINWLDDATQVGVPRGEVVPRILLASGRGGELRRLRGELGTAIGELKKVATDPPPSGIMVWL